MLVAMFKFGICLLALSAVLMLVAIRRSKVMMYEASWVQMVKVGNTGNVVPMSDAKQFSIKPGDDLGKLIAEHFESNSITPEPGSLEVKKVG